MVLEYRTRYNLTNGDFIGQTHRSGTGHTDFYDAKLVGSTLYTTTQYSSSVMLMSFDYSSNSAGQSYILPSTHGGFVHNNNTESL